MAALVYLSLIIAVSSKAISFQSCEDTQIFSVVTLKCSDCPTNMVPNLNQDIPTSCVCKQGYYPTGYNTCAQYASGISCNEDEYIPVFSRDGSSSILGLTCQPCDSVAYKNENGTGCTPCPINMNYVAGEGCTCQDSSMITTELGCFPSSYTSGLGNLGESSSQYSEKLKYLVPACYYFKDLLSCSYLVNLCTYSSTSSDTAECKFFSAASEAADYLFFSTENPYYMPAGTFNKESIINFKLISFLPTGNYVGEKTMRLPDIVRCGMPSQNSGDIRVGNNIDFTCDFNFNQLLDLASAHTYKEYVYELFIQGAEEDYYQVAIYLDGAEKPTRRFFLQDTTSSDNQIKVATSLSLQLLMNTTGHLLEPQLHIGYTTLSVQDGQVTPDTDKTQTISYEMTFKYDLATFNTAFIVIVIIVSVLALLQALARTYIGHLNREPLTYFLYYLFKFWALWMFYFLLCISGYWFLFSKTTQNLYVFIPSAENYFYDVFYILAGAMGVLRIITIFLDKKDKLSTEVFMINWEKGQFKNSWREIFIINSLAEFYTHRTISVFWLLLVVMFFLVGLSWSDHAAEVTHTNISSIYYFHPINRMLLYFLSSSIFIIVGIVFKILRRLSVIKWPYPFQNFVDYCNVTNISFFFMKKRSAQAYYIHASIVDRTEVTYKEINEAIRRGLNKTRSVANEIAFQDMQRMYTVYVCKDLEDKFNHMLKKIEDEEHDTNKNTDNKNRQKKHILNPREEFIDKKLKPHLEVIGREGSNRNKTIAESLLGMPPIDLRDPTSLQNRNFVIFDDTQEVVTNVFPNGNEFEEIHTIIIIFLMFVLMTASVPIAAFLTYFVDEYLINGWIANSCRERLEKMTKVKEGFML